MNLQHVNVLRGGARYLCIGCQRMRESHVHGWLADLDGVPFVSYYCNECAQRIRARQERLNAGRAQALAMLPSTSYEQAERHYHAGYISEEAWRYFLFYWTWCAARFGGSAGARHDIAYGRLGPQRYSERIERVRRWAGLPERSRSI